LFAVGRLRALSAHDLQLQRSFKRSTRAKRRAQYKQENEN
jgi:hypothetical protein